MKTTSGTESLSDMQLVEWSLTGDREAFGRIVERYQSLVCSITYGATGSVALSEDIAQETFLTAWRELAKLSDAARLRGWLCGIARNLVNNYLRRGQREPVQTSEPLDTIHEPASPEPSPSAEAVSREEETIVWNALGRIPETYREPLILFYREGQSVERVATALELSEDAVKQRLSRGRKLLADEVAAFVEGTLKRTMPGKVFTLGVLGALPLLATTAKAATVTVAATKGGSAAKAATGAGMLSALLTGGMMLLFSLFGVFGLFGRWIGRKMGRANQQSPRGRERIIQFWRTLAAGFLLLVLLPFLVPKAMIDSHPWLFHAQTWSLAAFYWLVVAALAIWVWQRRRDARRQEAEAIEVNRTPSKSYNVWITLGMIGPACILGAFLFALFFSGGTLSSKRIPEAEVRSIISERKDARFMVHQYRYGSKSLEITLPENHRINLSTPLDDSLLSALTEKGIAYKTLIEDRDFHNGGVRGWMVLLSTFIVVAGTVLLLRRPGTQKFYQQEMATPRAERREKNIVAACAALAMIAMSLLLVLFTIAHAAQTISGTEAGRIISEQKNVRFEVIQYDDGSKELWITLPERRSYPGFITPADESTLSLLAEKGIACPTYVQGRDFGYRGPNRWVSLLCIFILTAGAVIILWWAWKNRAASPTPARNV